MRRISWGICKLLASLLGFFLMLVWFWFMLKVLVLIAIGGIILTVISFAFIGVVLLSWRGTRRSYRYVNRHVSITMRGEKRG